MLQSELFAKTQKTDPKDETTINARLLIRGGFISKSSAGVYTILPLGLRVLNKIVQIIREEMNAIGGQELSMPALVEKKYWEKSNRWNVEVIYKTGRSNKGNAGAHDFEYGLGWTHEEVITAIAVNFLQSYKDLPKAVYQFQNKFRAETRAQGGLLRGREFLMKDLYSFHADEDDLNKYHDQVGEAYKKVFQRTALKTLIVEAGGGDFTKDYTHEFQVVNSAGEDTVYHCQKCSFAQNKEIYDIKKHQNCSGAIEELKAIEVGNIFKLGTRFSKSFNLAYLDERGVSVPIVMGAYGIGATRIMGTLVEEYNDERGIIWPASVAPFTAHLLRLKTKDSKLETFADKIYQNLRKAGVEVLYDDRENVSAGEKFADADLLGIPIRAVVSEKTGDKIEIKRRGATEVKLVTEGELAKIIKS